jgi:hypothetical protein
MVYIYCRTCSRCPCPLFSPWSIYIVELVLVVHAPSFLHSLYILYNENKFYNIYRLCRKEGTWTTRTSSAIYIDYAEKRGHGQREQVLQYI